MIRLSPARSALLRDLYDRTVRTLSRRPALAAESIRSHALLRDELRCEVRRGARTILTDLDASEGGGDSAATPGDLMRAALGACLATGYRVWAARFGIDFESVEIELTCDFDVRGRLGVASDVPVGWKRISLEVHIASDAPSSEVRRVVEHADRLSPMLANLSPAITRVHTLTVHPKTDPTPHIQDQS